MRIASLLRDLWHWLHKPYLWKLPDPSPVNDDLRDFLLFLFLLLVALIALLLAIGTIQLNDGLNSPQRWALGLLYAVFAGHIGTGLFIETLRDYMQLLEEPSDRNGEEPKDKNERGVPAAVVGIIERFMFTVGITLYGVSNENVVVAMAGWITLKMAANWNRTFPTTGGEPSSEAFTQLRRRTRGAIRALTADVVSLAHTFVAALIITDHLNSAGLASWYP